MDECFKPWPLFSPGFFDGYFCGFCFNTLIVTMVTRSGFFNQRSYCRDSYWINPLIFLLGGLDHPCRSPRNHSLALSHPWTFSLSGDEFHRRLNLHLPLRGKERDALGLAPGDWCGDCGSHSLGRITIHCIRSSHDGSIGLSQRCRYIKA